MIWLGWEPGTYLEHDVLVVVGLLLLVGTEHPQRSDRVGSRVLTWSMTFLSWYGCCCWWVPNIPDDLTGLGAGYLPGAWHSCHGRAAAGGGYRTSPTIWLGWEPGTYLEHDILVVVGLLLVGTEHPRWSDWVGSWVLTWSMTFLSW